MRTVLNMMSKPSQIICICILLTIVLTPFLAGHEHGSSIVRAAIIVVVGIVGGIVHALIFKMRNPKIKEESGADSKSNKGEPKGPEQA